ncbi:MAG TPA: hypothetical protein VGK89_01580 [Candidatus Eisenbacteria bacterium]|jgi:hypothetical protein
MITRTLRDLLWLGSGLALAGFVFVVFRRILHATPADPVEGLILEHVARVASQQPLYVEPAAATPSLMPGFPLALSMLAGIFGPHLWEPRALSMLAALATAGLVGAAVWIETLSWTLAVTSGGCALAGYGLLVGRPEVARPEIVMMALVLAGFVALRTVKRATGAVAAAIFLTAAWTVHAQAAWYAAAALFYLVYEERPRLIAFAAAVVVLGSISYVALSMTLGPWFNFSAWDALVQSLSFNPAGLVQYAGDELLGRLGVLTMAVVLSFALPTQPWLGPGGMWICVSVATVGAGLVTTQSAFAGSQLLVPSVVALAIVGPVSLQRITRHLSAWPGSSRLGGEGVVLAGLSLQFLMYLSRLSSHF